MERAHGDPEEIVRALLLGHLSLDGLPVDEALIAGPPQQGQTYSPYYIEIAGGGGLADYFEQSPVVDIDVYAPTRARAKMVASAVQMVLLCYPWSVGLGSGEHYVIDSVTCDIAPRKMPWDDESIRRQGAQYTLSLRR